MTNKNIKKPIKSLKEWKSEVFPNFNSVVSDRELKNNPVELALLLANLSVLNLKQ